MSGPKLERSTGGKQLRLSSTDHIGSKRRRNNH